MSDFTEYPVILLDTTEATVVRESDDVMSALRPGHVSEEAFRAQLDTIHAHLTGFGSFETAEVDGGLTFYRSVRQAIHLEAS